MHMVRHEDIDWTVQGFARGGMEQQFAEMGMKALIQPAGNSMFHRKRPLDDGKSTIEFWSKAREVMPLRLWRQWRWFHLASVAAFVRKPQIENQQFGGLVGTFLDQRLSSEEPLRTSCGALPRRRFEE
jgi:hypothetical protein